MSSVKNMALTTGNKTKTTRLTPLKTGLSLMVAASILGGCAGYSRDHVIVGSVPDDYRTRHPIVVSESEIHRDIAIPATMRTLSLRHRNVVRDFAMRFKGSGAKSIRLIMPVGSHNETAARWVSRQIIDELGEVGIRRSQVIRTSYHASGHGDAATLRIAYSAMTAEVDSDCGQWEENLIYNPQNRNYGNFGCATQSNLATMVANPNDLLGPRGQSEIDATRRDAVIQDWRNNGTVLLPSLIASDE